MRSAIVENGVVVNVIIGEVEGSVECPDAVGIGWAYVGGEFVPLAPPAPPPPTEDDYKSAIVALLDTKAKERRYDNAVSIATYVNSTNAAWAEEATAYVAWRDVVWEYAYTELAKVLGGLREQPTVADFLSELPTMTWPE